MLHLNIAVPLLLALCIIGISCGQQNFDEVNKSRTTLDLLRCISKTTNTLKETPQPPPSWHSPFNWTSVSMTHIGSSRLREAGTFLYDIPDTIPSASKELLVYVSVGSGDSSPGIDNHIKIYTQIGDNRYEKYLYTKTWNQNAVNTNSDNMWFPMPRSRFIYLTVPTADGVNIGVNLFAIGYR